MTPPPPYPVPSQSNNKKWLFYGCGGCLVVTFIGVIAIGSIILFASNMMKSSSAYQSALTAAQNSPALRAELGTPIRDGFMAQGSVSSSSADGDTTGSADMTIPLKGPNGSAKAHYKAKLSNGKWHPTEFKATIDSSGKVIDLTVP